MIWRHILRNHLGFVAGYAIVGIVVVLSIFAPWIAPYDPVTADSSKFLLPPSAEHIFGTDSTGMDVFSRIIYAPRIDLAIAIIGTALSMMIGAPLGAFVGYYERRGFWRHSLSTMTLRSADVLQAFPVFVLAIALVAVFGQGLFSIVVAIVFVNLPIYMRLSRTQVLGIRKKRYVEASVIAGVSDVGVIFRTILPNSMTAVLAHFPINIGWSILLTAGLSFVGAGVVAPTPEWGAMIATGYQNIITGQWWPSVFPGVALAITVYGFALIGSSIEMLYDPRRRAAFLRGEL